MTPKPKKICQLEVENCAFVVTFVENDFLKTA